VTSRLPAMFTEPWRLYAYLALHALTTHTCYTRIIYYKPRCNPLVFNGSNWMTAWFAKMHGCWILESVLDLTNFCWGVEIKVRLGWNREDTKWGPGQSSSRESWGRSPPVAEAFRHLWNTIVHMQLRVFGGSHVTLTDFLVFSGGQQCLLGS